MPTARDRATTARAKAEDRQRKARGPAGVPDGELSTLGLAELRTEGKRLLGADYDHAWDKDRDALIGAIVDAREVRRAMEEEAKDRRVERARDVIRDEGDTNGGEQE